MAAWTTPEHNTKLLTVACGDDFHAARVGFANPTPQAWTMSRCIAAPSTTVGDGCNPTGGAAWRPFTVAGNGLDRPGIATMSAAPTTIAVAGNDIDRLSGAATVPCWTWSDWIALPSVPRVDRPGAPRLLMIRTLVAEGTRWTGPNGGFGGYGLDHDVNFGFEHICGSYPMDAVTRPLVVPAEAAGLCIPSQPVAFVQFLTRRAGIVGMATGDSHHQGTTTTTQFFSFLLRATIALGARSIGRVPFGCVNCAQGGFASSEMFGTLDKLLPVINPSYVVLPGWTWNETNGTVHADEAAMEVFSARLLAAAEACMLNGAHAVFLTPFPRDPSQMTPRQMKPWKALRNAILDLRHTGAAVIDAADILGARAGGELTGTYDARMTSDTAHPNDYGHACIAGALAGVIERSLRSRRSEGRL